MNLIQKPPLQLNPEFVLNVIVFSGLQKPCSTAQAISRRRFSKKLFPEREGPAILTSITFNKEVLAADHYRKSFKKFILFFRIPTQSF